MPSLSPCSQKSGMSTATYSERLQTPIRGVTRGTARFSKKSVPPWPVEHIANLEKFENFLTIENSFPERGVATLPVEC